MKPFLFTIPIVLLLAGCQRADSTAGLEKTAPEISCVTLVSHLGGSLADDPVLIQGQTVMMKPHETEPPSARKESVVVTLPSKPPFVGPDKQYYLRGFAIGKLSSHNANFL